MLIFFISLIFKARQVAASVSVFFFFKKTKKNEY